MERLYWRPAHVSRVVHVLVAVLACAALIGAERFQRVVVRPDFEAKLRGAAEMERGMEIVKAYRVRHFAPVDLELDPTGSGMIGLASSPTTTNAGSLAAKRTTVNPNWAAALIAMLREAGVERGDLVAVGVSGSFPALNMAALIAIDELGLEAVSVASAGASSFGANIPGLSWLDMERVLADAEVFSTRTVAASLGGTRDRALGMDRRGRDLLREAIERNGVELIDVKEEIGSIDERMRIYEQQAHGRRYKAYLNAGGALVSIGPKSIKRLYRPGLNLRADPRTAGVDSVTMRFLGAGIPVVNLSKVVPLAEMYGLPVEPTTLPPVGRGPVFEGRAHDLRLVAALWIGLIAACYALLRLDLGARLVGLGGRNRLERMV